MNPGYVVSGRFRREVEAAAGRPLEPVAEPDDPDEESAEQLALLPAPVAAEVKALSDVYRLLEVPMLCGLKTGAFCTYAAINGFDEDELRDMFRGDEAGVVAAMSALELYNAHGSPYVVVSGDGVGLLDEDPGAFRPLGISLEDFLSMLIAADAAARRDGAESGRLVAAALVGERHAARLVRSSG